MDPVIDGTSATTPVSRMRQPGPAVRRGGSGKRTRAAASPCFADTRDKSAPQAPNSRPLLFGRLGNAAPHPLERAEGTPAPSLPPPPPSRLRSDAVMRGRRARHESRSRPRPAAAGNSRRPRTSRWTRPAAPCCRATAPAWISQAIRPRRSDHTALTSRKAQMASGGAQQTGAAGPGSKPSPRRPRSARR